MDEKKKKDWLPLLVVGSLVLILVVCLILLAVKLVNRGENAKKQSLFCKLTEVDFTVSRYLSGNVYVIKQEGMYGMADADGNLLVPAKYKKFVYFDNNWVGFEDAENRVFVFDRTGTLLYEYDYYGGSFTSEDGVNYEKTVFYRHGMRIEVYTTEDGEAYGAGYYNAANENLIVDFKGYHEVVQVTSLPDESGTAAVICGDSNITTIYRITKDGYQTESFEEQYLECRDYYHSGFDIWNETNLVDGWMKVFLEERRGELLNYSTEQREVMFNIYTREIVELPQKYQYFYEAEFYQYGKGLYYGIAADSLVDNSRGRTEETYYAICCGSKILTEEIYAWICFDEKYIIAGNDVFTHILDYEGNVLVEYKDVAAPFVDGKTLVYDGTGVFYIDDTLTACSEYIMENIVLCCPGYIRKPTKCYLVKWIGNQEE